MPGLNHDRMKHIRIRLSFLQGEVDKESFRVSIQIVPKYDNLTIIEISDLLTQLRLMAFALNHPSFDKWSDWHWVIYKY